MRCFKPYRRPRHHQDWMAFTWENWRNHETAEPQLVHVRYTTARIPCAGGMVGCQGDLAEEKGQAGSCKHRLPSLTSSLSMTGGSVTQWKVTERRQPVGKGSAQHLWREFLPWFNGCVSRLIQLTSQVWFPGKILGRFFLERPGKKQW